MLAPIRPVLHPVLQTITTRDSRQPPVCHGLHDIITFEVGTVAHPRKQKFRHLSGAKFAPCYSLWELIADQVLVADGEAGKGSPTQSVSLVNHQSRAKLRH